MGWARMMLPAVSHHHGQRRPQVMSTTHGKSTARTRGQSLSFTADEVAQFKDRFMRKVAVHPNGCWEWTAAIHSAGYGAFCIHGTKAELAHRISFAIHTAPIPAGMNICHTCDNRKCCNPEHLFLGTQQDNLLDALHKGRMNTAYGERSSQAKLTHAQVEEIRSRFAGGEHYAALATEFGVARNYIHALVSRRWRKRG